ncbi:hypothetical protein K9M50_03620 [Patescibacteria group bacterium]|nr:hypothetical protein [Patescibacteria group bacterium]
MQLRVWKLDRGATLLVRLFRHNSNAKKKLWDGKRTNGEVSDLILDFLENQECITNKESWDYSVDTCNTLTDQDEYEEKEKCIYFAWLVKKSKLDF